MITYTNFFRILSTFVIAAALLSLTGAHTQALSGSITDYKFGYGPIASINNDWILAGHWMGYHNPSNLTDSGFHSTFDMVMKNGSAPHMHQISNATVSDVKMDGNNSIIQGSVEITMKDGPVSNVPTNWTISNNNTLAIDLDPSKINNHFGESPIYGLVLTPDKEMKIMNKMMEDSKFMDQWIPLMMQNMMSTLNMNGENISSMPQMMNHSISNNTMEMNMENNTVIP
ncbi:hypothetical protein [Candidatus Nitrosocosmicus arcticus]|uniref:Uncharacterized protein n=1 Tax=Candidatus Nitrosocosmicus arcticus TaxID=2035267 RepID=A0A557SW25_9ARCH|nr:hypothetical protein [Candidatus Nitrosocosmicus arcticus]TVP40806.1 exported protein of unknown function [Candidatus Nitrosocosmicus arcticus]